MVDYGEDEPFAHGMEDDDLENSHSNLGDIGGNTNNGNVDKDGKPIKPGFQKHFDLSNRKNLITILSLSLGSVCLFDTAFVEIDKDPYSKNIQLLIEIAIFIILLINVVNVWFLKDSPTMANGVGKSFVFSHYFFVVVFLFFSHNRV